MNHDKYNLHKKVSSRKSSLNELQLIDLAKNLLIERLKFSEAQAHRYIEKQAMDQCVTKKVIAEKIIRFYEK